MSLNFYLSVQRWRRLAIQQSHSEPGGNLTEGPGELCAIAG